VKGGVRVKDTTVLIIEDNMVNLKLVRGILRRLGIKTLEATDAETGIVIARERKPDLIIMDIELPNMDGIKATKILKNDEVTRHIPIVAVTAFAMNGDRETILAAGCDEYISKPFKLKEFTETVKKFLDRKD